MPVGVVTLSEGFAGEPGAAAYERMVEAVARSLAAPAAGLQHRLPGIGRLQMLGTSGTVTTLAAVHLGLKRYERRLVDGVNLSFAAVQAVSSRLRELDDAARAAHPCIGLGRADLVVAGCAILDAVHRLWPVDSLWVADRGLREGILATLMGRSLDQLLHKPAA